MKTTSFKRLFIIGTCLVLNKLFLFRLISANNISALLVAFVLLILNFMILTKSIDKLIDAYEESKKKQARAMSSRLLEH